MLAGLAAGYAYAGWRAELRLAQSLPGDWEGRDVAVTGIVATLPQNFGRGVRFVFEVEAPAGGAVPRRISLVWYRGADDDEAGLLQDYDTFLERLAPHEATYRHNNTGEDNGDAHIKRQLMGREVVVAITDGKLDFGPWEQIFYGEFDGRRRKRVLVKVIGE